MSILQSSFFGKNKQSRTVGRGVQSVFLIIFTLLMTNGILARLVYLQIVQGSNYRERAESNRIRLLDKQPERGNIFDHNGKLLATTHYPHSVYLWPMAHKKQESWAKVGPRLSQILGMSLAEIEAKLEEAGSNSNKLVRIKRDLNVDEITALREYENELKNVEINTDSVRYYPYGRELAHVLGYTRELTPEQYKQKKDEGYRLRDVIGQMGVEKAYEDLLRGEWGGQQLEVDSRGRPLRILGQKQAKPGSDLRLTIDLELQIAAEKALGDRNGTIIVMNPHNGGILAMVSHPTFDPNVFSKHKPSPQELQAILSGANHPLLNRALRAYPPASTFKIITTTAALESGQFSPNTVLPTYGSLNFSGTRFNEWNHTGFGTVGFVRAIAMSSDTFFYQIGARLGGSTLIEWTRKYGFGRKTGFEFSSEESKGFVPDEAWKQKTWKMPWTVGDSVNMSIGQGALLATPLQVGVMFAVPANGGYQVQPHLLEDNKQGKTWRESVDMKPTTIKVLREGLRKVVTEGTGKALNVPTLPPVAGKTGTAEAWQSNGVKANHAWFGGYAPADHPEILVIAFAEHSGGGGGSVAGPMALQVMEKYFKKSK